LKVAVMVMLERSQPGLAAEAIRKWLEAGRILRIEDGDIQKSRILGIETWIAHMQNGSKFQIDEGRRSM